MNRVTGEQAPETAEEIRALLNEQAGMIQWRELQRFFARGVVIRVDPELDLLDVALRITQDERASVEALLECGQVTPVSDSQAARWLRADAELWSVVVAPWVLVQAKGPASTAPDEGG